MSQVNIDKNALKKIAWALNGIDAADLSRAEEQILEVLVDLGIMVREDMGDWIMCHMVV